MMDNLTEVQKLIVRLESATKESRNNAHQINGNQIIIHPKIYGELYHATREALEFLRFYDKEFLNALER